MYEYTRMKYVKNQQFVMMSGRVQSFTEPRPGFAATACWILTRTVVFIAIIGLVDCQYPRSRLRRHLPYRGDPRQELDSKHFEYASETWKYDKKYFHPQIYKDEKFWRAIFGDTFRIGNRHSPGEENSGDGKSPKFVPSVPSSCKDKVICPNVDSYPIDHIMSLDNELEKFRPLAVVDTDDQDIKSRFDGPGDVSLCKSEKTAIEYPKAAQKDPSDENSWYTVVNKPTFQQGLRVSRCSNPGNSCKAIGGLTANLDAGYSASCKQLFVHKALVVLDPDTGNPRSEFFSIPSSCCCQVTFSPGDPESRFVFLDTTGSGLHHDPFMTRRRRD